MIATTLARFPRSLRRIVALLLPLLLLALGIGTAWAIERAASSQAAWRDSARRALSQGQVADVAVPEITSALEALPVEAIWSRFYSAESSGANQIELVADVSQALTLSGIQNAKIDPVATRETDNVLVWGCESSFAADAAQLHTFAERLRTLPRYVKVSRIVIKGPQMQTLGDNPVLSVELSLEGFGAKQKVIATEPKGL